MDSDMHHLSTFNILIIVSIILNIVRALSPDRFETCVTNCSCEIQKNVVVKADCSLRGWVTVPSDLPTTIKWLDISHNNISSLTYKHLFRLGNLLDLNASHNNITILSDWPTDRYNSSPEDRGNRCQVFNSSRIIKETREEQMISSGLKVLRKLDLSCNLLPRIENNTFVYLSELQILDISKNKIEILSSLSFSGLHCLVSLDLSSNYIPLSTESYPDDVFAELPNLKELNLHVNVITLENSSRTQLMPSWKPSSFDYPDKALSYLVSLQKLYMDGLPDGKVPGVGFRNLTQLTVLHIGSNKGHCNIRLLSEYFFFNINTTKLIELNLQQCQTTYIHPNTFSYLPTLHSLSLLDNKHLGFPSFAVGAQSLSRTQIKKLDLTNINNETKIYIELKSEWLYNLRNTSIENLILDKNSIVEIELKVPVILPRSIKVFSVARNKLLKCKGCLTLCWMENMEIFNGSVQNKFKLFYPFVRPSTELGNNFSFIIPQASSYVLSPTQQTLSSPSVTSAEGFLDSAHMFSDNSRIADQTGYDYISHDSLLELQNAFCPSMTKNNWQVPAKNTTYKISRPNRLELMYQVVMSNKTSSNSHFPGPYPFPRSLKEVYISETKLGYAIPEITILNNVLEHLESTNNFLWCFDGPMYGLHKLKFVDLSNNYCIAINPTFVSDMPALETLLVSYNTLGPSLENDSNGTTFSKSIRLKYIDLSHNDIRVLHSDAFLETSNLHTLILSNNALHQFNTKIGHLTNLTLFNLSRNDLSTLSSSTIQDIDQISSVNPDLQIDITNNPLICDCSTLDFLGWYRHRNTLFHRRNISTCQFINGTIVSLSELDNFYNSLWKICNGSTFLVFALTGFFLVLILWTSFGLYRIYRVRLLFYIYISSRRYFHNFTHSGQHSVKDVFLVYDEDDPKWRRFLCNVVRPSLNIRGVSCFISEVDTVAGKPTRMIIEESVLAAHKTLVLLTKDLFDLDEREMEVYMAKLSEEMRMSKVLYFLQLERIPDEKIPQHLRGYIQANRPIFYNKNDPQFWDKLANTMKS